jgi:serine/threonine-protein kinase
VVLAAGWWLLREGSSWSARSLACADTTVLLVLAVCWSALGCGLGHVEGFYIATLAVFTTLMLRAIFVPSEPRRTMLTSLPAGAAPVITGWLGRERLIAPPNHLFGAGEDYAVHVLVGIGLWGAAAVALAGVTSRVIYGLVEQVREARQLGQYTLEDKIGEGGMGEVYRARHALLRRPTAIKLLSSARADEKLLRRFEQEVQLTSQLSHPNVIAIYDFGRTPDGVFYYAMELLDGWDLERLVHEHGPLSAERTVYLLTQACGALAEAHEVGLIHRDVKPANLIACMRGGLHDFVKVLDFGLVKQLSGTDSSPGLTGANVVTGTPHFMAPEAIRSPDSIDARADVYALGAVAYFLLTGGTVFEAESLVEVCSHHLHTKPVPPSERAGRELPPELDALVLACLAKDAGDRPQSAADLARRLAAVPLERRWTEQDARAWWASRGCARARNQIEAAKTLPQRTMKVAFDRRDVA